MQKAKLLPPRPWYRITAKAIGEAEILIYDEIADPFFSELLGIGISAKSFAKELKDLGELTALTVRINSPGGDVFQGQAIYSLLTAHKARKTVYVDGLAASIASVIAMAGDEIVIPENAMLMIHNPSGSVLGTAGDMRKMAEDLDKVAESISAVYVRKTGQDEAMIKKLMDEETWMTGAEAVELGFADRQTEAVQMAAKFDLSQFRNVPAGLQPAAKHEPPTATHEEDHMEPITVEIIQEKHPAVAAHFHDAGKVAGLAEGKQQGVETERARIKGIRAAMLPGMEAVCFELIELGVSAEEAGKTFKARKLTDITNAAPKTTGGGSDDASGDDLAHLAGDERWKAEWAQNRGGVRDEFTSEAAYLAFKKAETAGRARIFQKG